MAFSICNCCLNVFNFKTIQTRVMVLVLCTSSNDTCMKFQEDVFNSFHITHIHDFVKELVFTKFKGE